MMLSGCGSGGHTVEAPTRSQTTGTAVFSIVWPQRTATPGRLVPLAANSIDVHLTSADGTVVLGDALIVRPAGGGASTVTLSNLPLQAALLSATAYPNADGTGTALASAQEALTLVAGTTPVSLTMASTITTLTVSPATNPVKIGKTASLVATATDASGNVVLITASKLTWTSSAPANATVDATGTVKGIAVGSATITAKETESGVSGTASVNVSAPAASKTISFAAPVSYAATFAGSVIAGDFDGDGNPDVAIAAGGNVVVFWGHGDGTLDPGVVVYTGTGDLPTPQLSADMNNDGKLDIVCGANYSSTVYVLLNTGNRTFSNVVAIPVSGGTKIPQLAVGDFNGDGTKDVAAVAERSSNGGSGFIAIFLANGSGGYSAGKTYGMGDYDEGITAGDINGDGKIDLIGTYISGVGGAQIFLGNGDGTFTSGSRYDTAEQNVPMPVLADFNQDGKVDLGLDDYFDNNMGVLFGNGNGTFQQVTKYSDAPYPLYWQAVDLDGDGYPDIVTPNAGTGMFTVLQNQGNGLFAPGVQFNNGGSNTRYCATADFNKDGKPDLVFSCETSNSIQVLINTTK